MIFLRFRSPGSTEWTLVSLEGEDEDHIASLLAGRLHTADWVVEGCLGDNLDWEPIEDWEED